MIRKVGALLLLFFLFFFSKDAFAQTYNVTVFGVVSSTAVAFSGSDFPDSIIYFYSDGLLLGTTLSNNTGTFSVQFNNQTAGLHTFTIYSQDPNSVLTSSINISRSLVG